MQALWVSKTGLDAQQTNINVITNNLANVNTVGFKRDRAGFENLLYQTIRMPGGQSTQDTQLPTGLMLGTGVRVASTSKIFNQGASLQTSNPLDLAINGRGFFQITMPDGTTSYTRDGQFQLSSDGQVVNSAGYKISPAITIPANTTAITIGTDGTVSAVLAGSPQPTQIGQIQLADFVNIEGLQPISGNLYVETAASGSPQTGSPSLNGLGATNQGALEGSNINVVEELVSLIEAQRAYEMNSKAIAAVDDMLAFTDQIL